MIPETLLDGPFSRSFALSQGVSERVLEGPRFRRIHHRVYRHRDHEMSWEDDLEAARLALPAGAVTTGLTRVQELGLDLGPRVPLHFVLQGDHHLCLEGVVLHRTACMPPHEDGRASVAAAYVECCRWMRTLDLIKVGDWLLRGGHLAVDEVTELITDQPWRAGADQAAWVCQWLRGGVRSLLESELRSILVFGGLPEPEVNAPIRLSAHVTVLGDLWWPSWRVCAEYEGQQHQADRDQYVADIDRYRLMRRAGIEYAQVTKEHMRSPRAVVREIHELLVSGGYQGPAPDFEGLQFLFQPLADVMKSRAGGRRAS